MPKQCGRKWAGFGWRGCISPAGHSGPCKSRPTWWLGVWWFLKTGRRSPWFRKAK